MSRVTDPSFNLDELIFLGVGNKSGVDHVAVEVTYGMLIAATTLFQKLGFKEDKARRVETDSGRSRFMTREGSITIKLTEPIAAPPARRPTNTHVAIRVDFPITVANMIERWGYRGAQEVRLEQVGNGKILVTIYSILTVPIELVPSPLPTLPGIVGIEGSIEITHWHVGDDIRISVYDASGNSFYMVTDSHGAKDWIAGFSAEAGSGTVIIREGRGVAEITRVNNEYHVICLDSLAPNLRGHRSRFSLSQAEKIISAFSRK